MYETRQAAGASHGSVRASDNVLDLRAAALRLDHPLPEHLVPEPLVPETLGSEALLPCVPPGPTGPTRDVTPVEPIVVVIGLSPVQAARVMEVAGERATVLVAHDVARAVHLLDHALPAVVSDDAPRLRVDRAGREISWCGRTLPLSAREFDLLALLAEDTGRVWTFAALTEQVWRRPYLGDDESVVSAVKRLRRRLATVTADLRIASVRGIGYRLSTGGT